MVRHSRSGRRRDENPHNAEEFVDFGLCIGRQQVEPKIGSTDIVCLFDDRLAAAFKALGCAEKGKGEQRSKQGKDSPFDDA